LKIAAGSDEKTVLTDFVIEELKRRGHNVALSGPLKGDAMGWPDVGESVGLEVGKGGADQGIIFCWTGTGVTIAANKVRGVRVAWTETFYVNLARIDDNSTRVVMGRIGLSQPFDWESHGSTLTHSSTDSKQL